MKSLIKNLINKFKNRNNKYYLFDGPNTPFPGNEIWLMFYVNKDKFYISPYTSDDFTGGIHVDYIPEFCNYNDCIKPMTENNVINLLGSQRFEKAMIKIRNYFL